MIAAAIYVVWYVIDALDGFDPDYRPGKISAEPATGNIIKGGPEIFDPSKKTPEPGSSKYLFSSVITKGAFKLL